MSRKKTIFRSLIAGGVAGAAFGGMLGAALGEGMEVLQGAVIGGVLGVTAARLVYNEATKGQKHVQRVAFPTGRESDFLSKRDPFDREVY